MTFQTDQDLLIAYAKKQSQEAFAELVRRHVHLVHAAAIRQARWDGDLADDITQAVFIVLARRAETVSRRGSLVGWLIRTTRYAAMAALKARSRRRGHEQKAAGMKSESMNGVSEGGELELGAFVDEALSRLPGGLRDVLALRYLQNRPVEEIAVVLGISEGAVRKRIGRGLGRIRARFGRRGIRTPEAAVEAFLGDQAAHVAPGPLVVVLTASTFCAEAGEPAATIARGAEKAMSAVRAKVVLAATVVGIVLAAGVTFSAIHYFSRDPDFIPASAGTAAPAVPRGMRDPAHRPGSVVIATGTVTFALPKPGQGPSSVHIPLTRVEHYNANAFGDVMIPGYELSHGIDPQRGTTPIAFIKSIDPDPDRASRILPLIGLANPGYRIRLTMWSRAISVRDHAEFRLIAASHDKRTLAEAGTIDGPIRGTTGWRQYHVVLDIPRDATNLILQATLKGPGELWTDDFVAESSPTAAPTSHPVTTRE